MSKTLRYGTDPVRLEAAMNRRIERFVFRRRSPESFEAARAAEDYARQVALEVTPHLAGRRMAGYTPNAPKFGKRVQTCNGCLSPADCCRTKPGCFRG